MPVRLRKLIGTVILMLFVPFYALMAMSLAVSVLPGTNGWIQAIFYLVAGLFWVLPAGVVVTWMVKPRQRRAA